MGRIKLGYYIVGDGREEPRRTLNHAILAEKAGFDTVWTSDHFEPFTHNDRNSPFAWVWLSAAAERTRSIQLGTGVTAPILRYNPAILAQAFATLALFYTGRIFLGLGAGEAINESPCGYSWPGPAERVARLEEAIRIIKLLWEEDFVTFAGRYFQVKEARIYNKPEARVPIYVAATGPRISEIAGMHADGFLYQFGLPTEQRLGQFKSVIWPSVEKGARRAGRDPSTIEKVGSISSSYAKDGQEAFKSALGKKGSLLPEIFTEDIHDPKEIERRSAKITDDEVASKTLITDNAEEYIKKIEVLIKAGFSHIYVSNWGPRQEDFLDLFKGEVIPYVSQNYGDDDEE